MDETHRKKLAKIIAYAAKAPSTHNSQPWEFAITHDAIRLYPDLSKRLSVSDPEDRELYISLGCVLENLIVALTYEGYGPRVQMFPAEGSGCIRITFAGGSTGKNRELYKAIPKRTTNRSKYLSKEIENGYLTEISNLNLEEGVSLAVITDEWKKQSITELVTKADHLQLRDKNFRSELKTWIRFNKSEARKAGDGLSFESIGSPLGPRWLGSFFIEHANIAKRKAKMDENFLTSSPVFLAFVSESEDKTSWINTGRSFERVALFLTSKGIAHAHLNQPIEVPHLRLKVADLLKTDLHPQLLLRIGYAKPGVHSQRRPVENILMETEDTLFLRHGNSA